MSKSVVGSVVGESSYPARLRERFGAKRSVYHRCARCLSRSTSMGRAVSPLSAQSTTGTVRPERR
jgi:hypothetical protein